MAGQIKGMTIEIGGNTAPLNQALKDTNKEINSTQKELKEVERLLKLDPKNTELLAEKQKLLTTAVDQTSEKLSALKKAKEEADKKMQEGTEVNSKEYRTLQKEIITTTQQLKNYEKELESSKQKIDWLGESAGTMNKAMQLAGVGVLGLGAGLLNCAKETGAMADEINTLAKQTGLSTEQIQKFKYASDIVDVSLDTLTGSLSKLTKNMASAASKGKGDTYNAFQKLGVSITDVNGELRNNQDVFKDTIKALGEVQNETERDAISMQIFGKSAQDLNPLILGGVEQLEALGQEAEDLGLILSQEALDGANAFNDSIDQLKATVTGAFAPIGAEIATSLQPVMEKVGELIKWLIQNKDTVVVVLAAICAGIAAFNMVTMIQGMVKAFQAWKIATEGMSASQAILNAVMNANPIALVATAIAALVAAIVVLWNTNDGFRDSLIGAWEAIKNACENVWGSIKKFFIEDIPNAFNTTINFVKENWQSLLLFIVNPIAGAIKLLYDLNPQFREWVDNLIENIKQWFGNMADIGRNIVEGLWNGIKNAKDWLIGKIKEFCDNALGAIKKFFGIESPSKVMRDQVGKFMAEGIGVGFSKEMPSVIDEMQDKLAQVTDALQTELSFSDIPQIEGNKVISENRYVTNNYSNTIETVRQPAVVELILEGNKVARAIIPALNNEYNRLGVKV